MREAGETLLTRLLETLVADVPGGIGAALTLVADSQLTRMAAMGPVEAPERMVWASDGVARKALRTGRPLATEVDQAASGVRGVLVLVAEEDAERSLVVTVHVDRVPDERDLRRLDRVLTLVSSAVGVVEYCSGEEERAEQMLQMVQYRRVIEQAKGLVMAATRTDAESAFATLARASQHFNVRLRNLSVALVELVGGSPAEGPSDPEAVVTPGERDRLAAARMWAALRSSASGETHGGG